MTVNTNALVPAAPKSGKSAETGSGDRSQPSAKEAAAEFQSVLHGMKRGETPAERAGENARHRAGQDEPGDGAQAAQAGATTTEDTGAPNGRATFSTSNLVDALRQVSHTVLSRGPGLPDGEGEGGTSGVPAGLVQAGGEMPATATALPPSTLLAANSGRQSPGNRAAPAGGTGPHQALVPGVVAQVVAGNEEAARTGTSSLFAQFGVEPESVSDTSTGGGRRSLLPEEAAGTVKILRQETHFAPNMRLSPAQQVGDQIATALKSLASENSMAAQNGVTHKAEGPVLKTLDIQLTPHELGTVKVSLRMVGDTVEVTLQTSKAQTADLLKQDRQLLDQMLRATGFKADAVTIQAADDRGSVQTGSPANGNTATGQNNAGSNASAEGQQQNSNGGNAGQQQGRPGQNSREGAFPGSEALKGKGHEDDTGNSLSDGIYL